MNQLLPIYRRAVKVVLSLRSPMLLALCLHWGFQSAQTGRDKLHNLPTINGFFTNLNIPFAALDAHFVAGLEFVGGILSILGLFFRPIAFLLGGNILVVHRTADDGALTSIFSDPEKFYVAYPNTFLFASLMLLILGAGFLAVDMLTAKWLGATA